jgi:hypothetical protein
VGRQRPKQHPGERPRGHREGHLEQEADEEGGLVEQQRQLAGVDETLEVLLGDEGEKRECGERPR